VYIYPMLASLEIFRRSVWAVIRLEVGVLVTALSSCARLDFIQFVVAATVVAPPTLTSRHMRSRVLFMQNEQLNKTESPGLVVPPL
jgi:hypothetical protein